MAENSAIEWTTHTFNPWRGCTKISPGCTNCYADTLSMRNPGTLGVWGPNGTRVLAADAQWKLPLKWNAAAARAGERHRVFCASLADVFEDWGGQLQNASGERLWYHPTDARREPRVCVSKNGSFDPHDDFRPYTLDDARDRLCNLIWNTPDLDWLLLTKRAERMREWMARPGSQWKTENGDLRPARNLWLGVSVEDQQRADERIPHLLATPAAVRFLSCEPLLGPMNIMRILIEEKLSRPVPESWRPEAFPVGPKLHWVIVGGESGPNARPCDIRWVRSLVARCKEAGVACFVKQLGAEPLHLVTNAGHGGKKVERLLTVKDRKGGDTTEWPADLRVREFPTPVEARP